MAAGEGQGEGWQAFINLGGAEDEEAPPALAAQPALGDDDDDLPPPAHGGLHVPPALPVLPQGEVLDMIGDLVDPAAAHGAEPLVHGVDEVPAPLLPLQPQQPDVPIGEILEQAVMLEQAMMLDEPVLVQNEQALKAIQDGLLQQDVPVPAAPHGADLPVDGVHQVPASPLAPQPQQQLLPGADEDELEEASRKWDDEQALKRRQHDLLGQGPSKMPAIDMFALPPGGIPMGGGRCGSATDALIPGVPVNPGLMPYMMLAAPAPPQLGVGGIMHSALQSMQRFLPPPPAGMGMKDGAVVLPNFSIKEDPRKMCTACRKYIQHPSKVCGDSRPPNALAQHYCLCEPCQDRPPWVSRELRYDYCETCREYFRLNPAESPR